MKWAAIGEQWKERKRMAARTVSYLEAVQWGTDHRMNKRTHGSTYYWILVALTLDHCWSVFKKELRTALVETEVQRQQKATSDYLDIICFINIDQNEWCEVKKRSWDHKANHQPLTPKKGSGRRIQAIRWTSVPQTAPDPEYQTSLHLYWSAGNEYLERPSERTWGRRHDLYQLWDWFWTLRSGSGQTPALNQVLMLPEELTTPQKGHYRNRKIIKLCNGLTAEGGKLIEGIFNGYAYWEAEILEASSNTKRPEQIKTWLEKRIQYEGLSTFLEELLEYITSQIRDYYNIQRSVSDVFWEEVKGNIQEHYRSKEDA